MRLGLSSLFFAAVLVPSCLPAAAQQPPAMAQLDGLAAMGADQVPGASDPDDRTQVPLLPEPAVPGPDVTAAYESAFARAGASADADMAARLKDYKVIFVPGFLSDFDPAELHIPYVTFHHKIYFDEQLAWLKGLGVENTRLFMKSEDAVAENAPTVQAAIRASDRPVILIAHSKGGLDTLEALISDRSLLAKVRGLITLQSPYYGTPIADYVVSHSTLDDIAVALLLKMGGNKESMINLTTTDRQPYMKGNVAGVQDVVSAIPVLTVATWKDPVPGQKDMRLKPLRDFMLRRGLRSDGLVPVASALLPGSAHIKEGGLDHTVTVRPSAYIALDRIRMTRALLQTLLALPVPSAPALQAI